MLSRRARDITQAEISWLLLSVPAFVLLAQVFTVYLSVVRIQGIEPWLLRLLTVASVLGLCTFVVVNLLEVWKRYRMDAAQAELFLQDTLWRETRGEQRHLQRWAAWQRLRQTRS